MHAFQLSALDDEANHQPTTDDLLLPKGSYPRGLALASPILPSQMDQCTCRCAIR